ncbi:cyclin-dependent kinase 11A [Nematostella vectensis]|uniref:cyclin-dependent kinase 11A n=1 Tax=Nematostella vectensis TaxID=45351 RepID=UPI0020770FEA|nr:cyclin-dependent kinase 11A [Nematostella vectensis]
MSTSSTKLHKKRGYGTDDEPRTSDEWRGERGPDWKVKTLDEILSEKRRKLEGGEESPPPRESLISPSTPSEVIYQMSPVRSSPSLSTGSITPRKSKISLRDDEEQMPPPRKRKGTEGEEGEILSDGSDGEGRAGRGKRQKSAGSGQEIQTTEEKTTESAEGSSEEEEMDDEDEDHDDDDDDEEEEDEDGDQEIKGPIKTAEESDDNSSGSDDESEESSEEEGNQESAVNKQETATQDESSDSEESSEGSSEEDESETSEEERGEEVTAVPAQPTTAITEEEEDPEDIHKELLKAAASKKQDRKWKEERVKQESKDLRERISSSEHRHRDGRESWREKPKHRRRSHEEREQRRDRFRDRDEKGSDLERRDGRREAMKASNRENRTADLLENKTVDADVRSASRDSHSRTSEGGDKRDIRAKETDSQRVKSKIRSRDLPTEKEKTSRSSSELSGDSQGSTRPRCRPAEPEGTRDRKRGKESESLSKVAVVKPKEKRDSSGKKDQSETTPNPEIQKQNEVESLVLTELERKQFNTEVVDVESEESSDTDSSESAEEPEHDDSAQEEKVEPEEEKPGLPDYLPAIQGCRNVEEFQWLNRIEEGTYGVVYRAKEKASGEVVALKRLKMEKEKEGFPITSLREINTLLKAQHPNIVHVREIVVGSNMDRIYIVMDYVEHDLKTLMEHMTSPFTVGEVKTLLIQLLRATAHLHDNWILHRDLKTSNLLLNNRGILKVGDFGLAREYGSPLRHYTPIVVTLWYRAPELLLGIKEYSCPIDMWSVGCIFAELLTMEPLFPGRSEIDQINRIFKELGTPSDKIWPGPPAYSELPHVKKMTFTEYPYNQLRNRFGTYLTDKGFSLLNRFLTYDPKKRITAETALKEDYFLEAPKPIDPSLFPTWPAKSEMQKMPRRKDHCHSPKPPEGGEMFSKLKDEGDSDGSGGFHMLTSKKGTAAVPGFSIKF